MSVNIPTAFVQQYGENVLFLSQQKASRLRDAVYMESVRGTYAFFDQIGPIGYNTVINRNGDSPLNNTPYQRRRVQLQGYDVGDLIDKIDEAQMVIDPTWGTTQNFGFTMGRAIDDVIIGGLFSTAYQNSGLDGTTPASVAFPSSQQVAVNDRTYQDQGNTASGNSSLTVSKLIYAKYLFGSNNVDIDNDEVICATAQQGISALLTATPVTSIWYNSVKTLVDGNVNRFMGITIKQTELIITTSNGVSIKDGSGYMNAAVWVKSGMALGIGEDVKAEISPRADKRYSTYVYYQMLMGAARLEEVKVVQLKCDLTKTN